MTPFYKVNGMWLYIVDFDTMPALPITGTTPQERLYADALTMFIQTRVVTEPGKYGIRFEDAHRPHPQEAVIYKITDEDPDSGYTPDHTH